MQDKNVWINDGQRVVKHGIAQILPEIEDEDKRDIMQLLTKMRQFQTREILGIMTTKTLSFDDPRRYTSELNDARQQKIEGLLEKESFKVVDKNKVSHNANILGGLFVLSIKHVRTDRENYKARFVVQGHDDQEKHLLVHSSSKVRQRNTSLFIPIAVIYGFRLWSQDISQAYLQSTSKLTRDVYVEPKKGCNIRNNQMLKLLKPLYGLTDSGDYWHVTIANHIREELRMQKFTGELACFMRHEQHDSLFRLMRLYVDDSISTGIRSFEESSKSTEKITEKIFKRKAREYNCFAFAGINVEKQGKIYLLYQRHNTNKLEELQMDSTFGDFRSKRQEVAWLWHTRPHLCAEIAVISQITENFVITNQLSSQILQYKRLNDTATKVYKKRSGQEHD